MIKRICCLGSAAMGVAFLCACGSTDQVPLDRSKLSQGNDNAVATGGYWWTYTDHNDNDTQRTYHATIDKHTSEAVALQAVVDSDTSHGKVLEVNGSVPPALPWTLVAKQDPTTIDGYWPKTPAGGTPAYPDATVPAYPAAGIGFGYQHYNAMFDASNGGKYDDTGTWIPGKWVGIAFDMKANEDMPVVWVSMPTVDTDLPDPAYSDVFEKTCKYYTTDNKPADGYSTCFLSYRKGIISTTNKLTGLTPLADNTMAAPGEWHRYCVLFSDVMVPNWANPTNTSHAPRFDPTRAIKVQWDQYQPGESATAASHYDLSLDNVNMLTEKDANDPKNNCAVDRIAAAPGSGTQG